MYVIYFERDSFFYPNEKKKRKKNEKLRWFLFSYFLGIGKVGLGLG